MHEPLGLIFKCIYLDISAWLWAWTREGRTVVGSCSPNVCCTDVTSSNSSPHPKKNSHLMTSLTGDEVACGCGPNGLLKSSVSLSPSLFLWSLSLYHPPITHLSSFSHYLLFIHFYVSINLYIHPSSIYTSNYPSIYLLFYLSIIDLFIYRRGVKLIFCCGPHRSCGVLRRAVVTAKPK